MNLDVYSSRSIRRAAWQFLSGKATSALLTFIILLWLVRLLPVVEYGAYAVFVAGTELGFALAGLGLPWLAARFLPDYRLHAAGPVLARLCRRLLLWQALALLVLATVIAFAMDAYLVWASLADYKDEAWLALALLVFEGLGRFVCEGLMAPLMLQGQARKGLVLRQIVFLGIIFVLFLAGHVNLGYVLAAEVLASFIGWLVACIALASNLCELRKQSGETDWQEPRLADQWRMALRMHAAQIISLMYSPQILINLVQRALGAESAALFGFLRTLYEQIARYLPATLLFTVLRPKLIASYLQGGIRALSQQVNLVGKLSLAVLLICLVFVALGGDLLLELVSGGKFIFGGSYLLGLMFALVPRSQRQLLETVAVATGLSGFCSLASAIGLLALPLMIAFINYGLGLWAPILAILFGQFVLNGTLILSLGRAGYQADWKGFVKLAVSAIMAWLTAGWMFYDIRDGIIYSFLCLVSMIMFASFVYLVQVFTCSERRRLISIFDR